MEVFRESRGIAAQFDGPVDDLRRLLAFHGLRSGLPQYVVGFARKLEESKPFRTDLTALLRSTRDLDRGRLTSDQMLAILAVAVGGDEMLAEPNKSPETAHALVLVRMLLAGIGGWSDIGDRAAAEAVRGAAEPVRGTEPVRGAASPVVAREAAPAPRPRFAPAQAEPPDMAAVDVRAFVRSEERAEPRPEVQAGMPPEASPEIRAEVREESRSEMPHLRREPLSEVVRTPATPATPETAPRVSGSGWSPPGTQRTAAAVARAVAATAPEPQPRTEPQPRPEPASKVETQERPAPGPRPEPQARLSVDPVRLVSDVPPADSRGSEAAWPAAMSEATAAESGDLWDTEPADLPEGARRRPVSRKLALDSLLGLAAVALLAFGVFEGVRSRHATSPAPATAGQAPTTPARTAAPPVAAPPVAPPDQANSLPDQTAAATPLPKAAAPPPTVAARSSAPPAPHVPSQSSLPNRSRMADEGTEPAGSAPAHSTAAMPKTQPAAAPALTRAADLQPAPHGPVAVPEATMDRQLLATRKPVYPPAALAQDVNGTVVLRAFVSTDGTVRRTDVVTGPPLLVNSALAAASWRRYRPFLLHGRPVEVQTEITYHYVTP